MNQTTKDAVIEALELSKGAFQRFIHKVDVGTARSVRTYAESKNAVIHIDEALALLKSDSQWISCSDQLPEPNNEVLVTMRDCAIAATGQWTRKNKAGEMHWLLPAENRQNGPVTHWQPLPLPEPT